MGRGSTGDVGLGLNSNGSLKKADGPDDLPVFGQWVAISLPVSLSC